MNISIPSILLGLGVKCLLNWALVFIQRNHICKSFLGVFSVSLAIIDTALTLCAAVVHLPDDGYIFFLGLKLTRLHVCLLVQILGQVYSNLQWPVVILAGLDHFCTLTRRLHITRARWLVWLFVSSFLWYLAVLYVFLLSDFNPILEDVTYNQIQQCWVFHSPQIMQVVIFLLLSLGYAALHAGYSNRLMKDQNTDKSTTLSGRDIVKQITHIFLSTWALFLFFLAMLLLLPVGIPAYLGLNVAWLSFLNSILIAVLLCAVCPASQLMQGLAAVPPDSFCEWRFKFSLAAEDRT
ncbi:probable G-protein coupled receptor 160 [Notolabrus celidotus]|uniref:probable G-protein coupled receptor 160 n=1 Tax=Notolabrus celidotus TaxID=1203425 RepID=UPI00149088C2|nr:probable G-protein coupled receptor 160 [Notolabrus celidotus]XP_034559432.1 probable G-protein coupled receptor 160 [Notolabrus celidotus]